MILKQSDTILLTEHIHEDNRLGADNESFVNRVNAHVPAGGIPGGEVTMASLHLSKINYLFADGHCEFLDPMATLARTNTTTSVTGANVQNGMWTINPND